MKPLSPAKLLEADVTKQIKDFMEWRQWRPVRMQRTVIPGAFQTGEPGIADYLFIRYLHTEFAGLAVTCWVEMKRQHRGKMGDDQIKWRDREKKRGAIVLKANDLRDFERKYEELFGWLRTESWVQGQQQIGFESVSKSRRGDVTSDLHELSQSIEKGVVDGCRIES
jgi:hypothetical protein